MPVARKCASCGQPMESPEIDTTFCSQCRGSSVQEAPIRVYQVTAADVVVPAKPELPKLETFEELEIPDKFKQAIEAELTSGEQLLWLGRPSRNPAIVVVNPHLRIPIAVVMYLIAAGIWIGVLSIRPLPVGFGDAGHVAITGFVLLFTGVLTLIATLNLVGPSLGGKMGPRECYVVTNRRAIRFFVLLFGAPRTKSYLPNQLLAMERRDHKSVPGAGDLIFEYQFQLPNSGGTNQTGSGEPVRVPVGFFQLDQVREVEYLIRTTLLANLEKKMDGEATTQPMPAALFGARASREEASKPITVNCACGATLAASGELAGAAVKCPQCAASVNIPASAQQPGDYVEHGQVPADLKAIVLGELGPTEKVVWFGAPNPMLVVIRSLGWFAFGIVLALAGAIWMASNLAPAAPAAPPAPVGGQGKKGPTPPPPVAQRNFGQFLLPQLLMLLIGGSLALIPVVRYWNATHTCYALTTRRAFVRRNGLLTTAAETYSPAEVAGMKRQDSWFVGGAGDLIFRSVTVITTNINRRNMGQSTSTRTTHYGFLAISRTQEVEKMVRERLIDRFVDRLTEANSF